MESRPNPTRKDLSKAIRAAVSADAAVARVAELEAQLARERGESTRRMKEVDGHVRDLRRSLQDLQNEFKRGAAERERLRTQLEKTHAELAALRTATGQEGDPATGSSGPDTSILEAALVAAQAEVERLSQRVRELETRTPAPADGAEAVEAITRLEAEVRKRDQALLRAAERAEALERRLGASEDKLNRSREQVAEVREALLEEKRSGGGGKFEETDAEPVPRAAPRPAAEPSSDSSSTDGAEAALPGIPGLRMESRAAETPGWTLYFARELQSRRPVAVRLLSGSLNDLDGKRLDSLLLARHANLVSAISFGVSRSGPYVVFERPAGETAQEWVQRIGVVSETIALTVALQAARGLRQAAFHGALHCDLSPDTVRIDVEGRVRVEDVGVAALSPALEREVRRPEYASPERLRGSPPPDARSDVYSLGAVLFFLLTGAAPFEGDREKVVRRQATGGFPDPREKRPEISEETARLVMKLAATDPDQRHVTWDQVLVDIERRLPGKVSEELRGNLRARARRWAGDHPYLLAAATIGPLLLAAAIVYASGTSGPEPGEVFQAAQREAQALIDRGDLEGAREIYRRFLGPSTDPDVAREAAAKYDAITLR